MCFDALKLSSAVHADTGYVSRVFRAQYIHGKNWASSVVTGSSGAPSMSHYVVLHPFTSTFTVNCFYSNLTCMVVMETN